MKSLLFLAALLALQPLGAEPEGIFPKLSPRATVSQTIGTTVVSLDYHRPAVHGRKIWGELVPYGQVWRTGANEATTIRFSDPVKVEGHPVPAGTYAIFTIPGPDRWTLILSRRSRQFGAFEYNPKEDVLRFDVKPKVVPHTEWLSIEVYPASRSSAYVDMYWEKLRVSFLVDVDVDALVTARMKRAMARAEAGDWKIYCDAAEYLADQEKDLGQAMTWVDKSIRIEETPQNLFVKARLQHLAGQLPQAFQTLEKALAKAKARGLGPTATGPMQLTLDRWRKGYAGVNGGGARH